MPEAKKFIAFQAKAGNGHGYLNQPPRPYPIAADPPEVVDRVRAATCTCDEPEAPSGAWVDAESELAAERNRLRLLKQAQDARAIREALTIENRMRDAQRRAKVKHVDLSHEFFVMRKMLERGKEPAAVARLERLEARLDGVSLDEAA